jgi:hypothetical protein
MTVWQRGHEARPHPPPARVGAYCLIRRRHWAIWQLSTLSTAARAVELATITTYSPDGLDLIETTGPRFRRLSTMLTTSKIANAAKRVADASERASYPCAAYDAGKFTCKWLVPACSRRMPRWM